VVERKNRSLCKMDQTILDKHRFPRGYWAEAMNTACHVGNRIFLRAFLNKMCYELMHGRAPRVSHFRAFGCQCFILKKSRLDTFESWSSDGIFLGYASHSRAFHVLNLDTNLVMKTCEVTFDETQPCSLLTDKTRIHLRSASVRTYTFFTTGFPRFLSIRRARGLLALNQVLI
jgi:hypothetical protein